MRAAGICIVDMEVGDTGWTQPWALCRDERGHLSLNGAYGLSMFAGRPGWTPQMKVKKLRKGWAVDVTRCPLQAMEEIWGGEAFYVGGADFVPVRRVVWFNLLTLFAKEGAC